MLSLLVILLAALSLSSEPGRDPAQTGATKTPVDTASVSGVVRGSADTDDPIDGAVVTLAALQSERRFSVVSDRHGRFHIGAVPPGLYGLSATRAGYLSVAYGASRPARPGVALTLQAAQHLDGLGLRMIRGGLIAGRVISELGDGVPGASVAALPQVSGWPSATAVASTTTDNSGRYRLFGLPPGDYVVIVSFRGADAFREIIVMSSTQVAEAIADLERRQSGAQRAVPSTSAPRIEPRGGLAPVFYPGVMNPSHASTVAVGPGEERNDVDIPAATRPLAAVAGVVVGLPEAAAANVVLTLTRQGPNLVPVYGAAWSRPRVARLGLHKGFAFTAVEPGRYLLEARTDSGQKGEASPSTEMLWGCVEVDVTGADVAGLTLVLERTPEVVGRIHFQGSSLTAPTDLTRLRVSLSSPYRDALRAAAVQGFVGAEAFPSSAAVTPEGKFTLMGVTPGEYVLDVSSIPSGWRLASVSLDGREVVDTSVIVRPNSVPLVEVVFSDRHTSLSGTLQVPAGEAASAYVLVIVPADSSLRGPYSRRVRWTRPRTGGMFHVVDLPPGEYVVGAVGDFDQRDLLDQGFLADLAKSGARFVIRDGAETIQDLRISRDQVVRPVTTNSKPLRVLTIGR